MAAGVFKKYRHDSLMNDFDSIINEMDCDVSLTQSIDKKEESMDATPEATSPITLLPPLPPPLPDNAPLPPSQEPPPHMISPLPPPPTVSSPTFNCSSPSPSIVSPLLPPPPPPDRSGDISLNLTTNFPPPDDNIFSPTFPEPPVDFLPPFLSPDIPPPDMLSSDNVIPSEDEEPVGTSEAMADYIEESQSEDDLDFTDTDFAIDKMLDELQDFSLELGIDIPENKKGDFIMLSPVQPKPPELNTSDVDHLRFSIANFEETPEVDLDALLEDLCAMERDISGETSKNKEKNVVKVEITDEVQEDFKVNDQVFLFTPSPTTRIASPVMVTHDVKERLETLQTELESKEMTPEEQEAKIKAEKMKIALEKMKAASFQKLFIKVYNSEQRTNKTMMIDQTWTARDVKNKMMLKDDVEPGPNWCVLEKLPALFMERILEDNEYVLQTVLDWSRETENVLVFLNRRDKYMLFRNPQNFLLTDLHSTEDTKLAEKSKDILLREFFTKDSMQIPNSEGVLWLREGVKKWVKHFFVLRASGIYYNLKGRQKSRDMVCLASFEHNNVYLGVGFKKKFKAPTDHVICLKHPKVQTIKSKHMYCLCAEDAQTKKHWITVIRMAKYGYSMYEDYLRTQEELESVLLAGSQTALTRSESSGVSTGNGTTSSTFSADSNSSLSLNQNKRFGTERRLAAKKATNGNASRVTGKQNTLGSIFSTAWSKGVEDHQEDYSSSTSSIPESPWSPANNSLETPSYESGFEFSASFSNNTVNSPSYQRQCALEEKSCNRQQAGRKPSHLKGDTGASDEAYVDDMLNHLSQTVSNGIPVPPPPPPLPGDISIPLPPPPPILSVSQNSNNQLSEIISPPLSPPRNKLLQDGRPPPPPTSTTLRKSLLTPPLVPPPPPPPN